MMIEIIPALMPRSRDELNALLARLSGVPAVQLDVMDGRFVPEASYPYAPDGSWHAEELPERGNIFYELDLMMERPLGRVVELARMGARRLVFHIESDEEGGIELALRAARDEGVEAWIALGNDTPLSAAEALIPWAQGIQLMGIARIGFQGQPFDPRVLERLETLRKLHPDLPRSVDGAVSHETLERLVTAGATRLVAGSAVLNAPDPREAIEQLRSLI